MEAVRMNPEASQLEARLSYRFQNSELLQRALTHRSWLEGRGLDTAQGDNEQLEFLGDAVLGFIASEALVRRQPEAKEGQLSRWKSHLVSAAHLYRCAVDLGLGEYLHLGRGEERNGGRERRSLLADALEAVIAAIYLDGGTDQARQFIESHILLPFTGDDLDELSLSNNQKVDLQNRARQMGLPPPHYSIIAEEGPDHAKVFVVEVRLGADLSSRARSSTKRTASLQAAKELLERLDSAEPKTP